jgi:hypothetical protein
MAKKSKLKLVEPPPRKLGVHGMALWRAVQLDYAVTDAGGRQYLCLACEHLDRAEDCAAKIEEDGATILVNGVMRDHPLLRHEAAARAQCAKCLDKLNLTVEPVKTIGRPTLKGYTGDCL